MLSNIFDGLFSSTQKEEDICTQMLCNLIEKYEDIKKMFFRFLTERKLESELNITPQVKYEKHGRPDIVLYNDDYYIIVENKVKKSTPRTDNQPEGYFKELQEKNSNNKFIVFLLPDNYDEKSIEDDIRQNNLEGQSIKIVIRKWSELLNKFKELEISSKSDIIHECLDYFSRTVDLTKLEDSLISKHEIEDLNANPEILKIYQKLLNLDIDNKIYSFKKECIGIFIYDTNDGSHDFLGISPNAPHDAIYSLAHWKPNDWESKVIRYADGESYPEKGEIESSGYWTYYKINKLLQTGKEEELERFLKELPWRK